MSNKFKILAADKLAPEGLQYIEAQPDAELVNRPGLSHDELTAIVGEHDAMIVRSGAQVTAQVLANAGKLRVIARAGVGVDNIDVAAATAKGILVVNTAEASTITTAEHAFALMMALARRIGPAYRRMTEGGWDRNQFEGRQLLGKTLGVVGFGRIGRTVAERALAFGMKVLAFDPMISSACEMDGQVKMFRQFPELLPHCDILTFHVPLNDKTRSMLNRETFAHCRQGVLIVNAARGGVVDETALLEAVESGRCAGAALDVFTHEPLAADSPLRRHPNVLTTPHLGASTVEAQQAVSVDAAACVMAYLRGEDIRGAVNAGNLRLDLSPEQTAYVDLAQRMAKLQSPLITGIASVTIEITGQQLTAAANTIERMALVGLLTDHMEAPLNIVNVVHIAGQYNIALRTVMVDDDKAGAGLKIEVKSADGQQCRRIVGRVYQDMRPRVLEIDGYHMDMIPTGWIMLLKNEDRPGMIGLVGTEFGQAQINIADMTLSRRDDTALMVIRSDSRPSEELQARLNDQPGILKIAVVELPNGG